MGGITSLWSTIVLFALCFSAVSLATEPLPLVDDADDAAAEDRAFDIAQMYASDHRAEAVKAQAASAQQILLAGYSAFVGFVRNQVELVESVIGRGSECLDERSAAFAAMEQRCRSEPLECANVAILAALDAPSQLQRQMHELRTNKTALKHECSKCGVDDACLADCRRRSLALSGARRRAARRAAEAGRAAEAAAASANACLAALSKKLVPEMERLATEALRCVTRVAGGVPAPGSEPASSSTEPALTTTPTHRLPPKKVWPRAYQKKQ